MGRKVAEAGTHTYGEAGASSRSGPAVVPNKDKLHVPSCPCQDDSHQAKCPRGWWAAWLGCEVQPPERGLPLISLPPSPLWDDPRAF